MISAFTGQQIRDAEQPLLDSGEGAVLMQRAAYGLAQAVIRELKKNAGWPVHASRFSPAKATTAAMASMLPRISPDAECVRRRYSPAIPSTRKHWLLFSPQVGGFCSSVLQMPKSSRFCVPVRT